MTTPNSTTGSSAFLRLILGTIAGMVVGLFAAIAVGALVAYLSGSGFASVMSGFATLMVVTVTGAVWVRDRGKIRFEPAPELAIAATPIGDGYAGIVAALERPEARRSPPVGSLFLLGILLWFLLSMSSGKAFSPLLPLATTLVILVHEAGHWLAMKFFGYRDTRVFFVPFFGGLTVGTKEDAPAWQKCIVLLMGPLPGLITSLPLCLLLNVHKGGEVYRVLALAIFLNGFNLLPLHGLDGGQLIASLARRRPRVEAALQALMALGLLVVSIRLRIYLLVLVAAYGLGTLSSTYGIARAAQRLRSKWRDEAPRLADASDAYRRLLYCESQQANNNNNRARLQWMQSVHARIVSDELSAGSRALFGGAYLASIAFVAVDIVVLALRGRGG